MFQLLVQGRATVPYERDGATPRKPRVQHQPHPGGLRGSHQREHGHRRASSAELSFMATDGAGCHVDTTLGVLIHELPTFGALVPHPPPFAVEEVQLTSKASALTRI